MITARAFAKINLDLRILGVQADGYHELRTTFQSLALHDVLTFAPARGPLVVETDDPACPAHGNIVERAASALWRAAGRSGSPAGLRVRIDKRIPIAAGLGGGSADAAAALRAIARLWRIRLTSKELQTIAASLGADVPFFLEGGTVRGRGRGDMLTPLADRSAPLGGGRHPAVRRADGGRVSVVRSGCGRGVSERFAPPPAQRPSGSGDRPPPRDRGAGRPVEACPRLARRHVGQWLSRIRVICTASGR